MTTVTINRIEKGTRTFFYPTIEGKRINSVNFSKKWEAVSLGKTYVLNVRNQSQVSAKGNEIYFA